MSKIDLGRVVGPRGSKWFIGNSENTFTGDSINDAYLPVNSTILDSDINGKSVLDDIILNKQTGEYYKCVFPGNVSQAKWTYEGSMIGPQGKPGEQGIKGDKGDKGDRGPAFNFDASGHSSDKQNYNNEEVGFAFLDTDNGYIYIKTQDGWSDGFQFRGDKGTSVVSITQLNSQEDAGNNIITFYFDNNTSSSVTIKNGSKGQKFAYEDFTPQELETLKGPQGISISSIQQISSNSEQQTISFNLSNGESAGQVTIMNGTQGIQGSIWHTGTSLQGTGNNISLDNNELYNGNYRLNDYYLNTSTANYYICITAGNKESARWSYQGTFKGPKGEDGASITADAKGLYENRSNYDNQNAGFSYLAIDQGILYIKLTNNSGDWSDPVYIRGEKGERGETGYCFIPQVDENGILSWTNNSDNQISNPNPVNLRTAGTNIICSPVAPPKPYNGLIWIKTQNQSEISVKSLNIVKSSNKPTGAVENGTIWIKQ